MQTLISLQQATTDLSGLDLVGSTVTMSGNSATLSNATGSAAQWSVTSSSPAIANVTITNSSGQTVYTGTTSLSAGTQTYTWSGQGTNGVTWPDGTYTLSINATGANGQPATVSTQVQGVVTAVNASASPPTVTVSGQTVPISQIQSVDNGSSGALGSSISTLNSSIGSLTNTINTLSQYL
jgi:flagellar basal-body rod modification protein FlgD